MKMPNKHTELIVKSFTGEHKFLSNFQSCNVRFEGQAYGSVEHAFQAAKTLDKSKRKPFTHAGRWRACKAKTEGKKLKLRPDWESVKIGIMHDLLRIKFQDPVLKEKLLATEKKVLIEGNDWNDPFWGKVGNKGQNHLGILLMKVRDEIRADIRASVTSLG